MVTRQLKTFLRLLDHYMFPPKKRGESPWQTTLRAVPIIVLCVLLTYLLHIAHVFHALESAALDTFLRINPIEQKHSLIVDITEDDYQARFREGSRINDEELAKLLQNIAAGQPKAIVVDLDTADPAFSTLRDINVGHTPILWARSYKLPSHPHPTEESPEHPDLDDQILEPEPVLGGTEDDDVLAPIAAMTADPDGIVRSYRVQVHVREHDQGEPDVEATLPWQAVKVFKPDLKWSDERVNFNFCYDPQKLSRYPSSVVLDWASTNPQSWATAVKDKIVLLGGTYASSKDVHLTPVGKMAGVELITLAVESHLQDKTIRPAGDAMLVVADVVTGLAFAFLTAVLPELWVLVLSVLLAPVFAVFVSYLAFSKLSMWASFVPVIFGVYLHTLHDHIHEDRELRHEVKLLEQQVHRLEDDAPKPAADMHDE